MALLVLATAADGSFDRPRAFDAARSGDLAAFERLMRQHERLVLATALRLTGRMEDARDVSQEVFLKLYRNLDKVQASEAISSWLYRVTVNASHDLTRRRRPESPVEEAGALASGEAGPHEVLTED